MINAPQFFGRAGWKRACSLALSGLLLAGCTGVPWLGEKEARQEIASASGQYRPQGITPALPHLSATAGLSNYLAFALLNQPRVEEAYYAWAAAVERITVARSLPDPQFTFQMDIQNAVTSLMPGFMGVLPWPEKLRAGSQIASAESAARSRDFKLSVLQGAYQVKRAYYQLYFLSEKVRVNKESLALLADLEKLARAQSEAGKATLQDVLRAQIEQDRLANELSNLEDSRSVLNAQFKAALGLKPQDASPPAPAKFESTALDLTPEKLLAAALTQNQRLKSIEDDILTADAALTLAGKARLPDFSIGLMADARTTPTLYRPLGTVTLPIWRDKIAAQIAEAQANKRAAEARLSSEQISLAAAMAEKMYLFRESSRNLALLEQQLLPKARQSLELARSGYLAGQIDFFNVTDSERTLLSFEIDRVEAATQREIVLAELSLIVQGMSPTSMTAGTTPVKTSRERSSKAMGAGGM